MERKSGFKSRGAMKPDEIRRRRDDVTVEIRKQKREDQLAKRRNLSTVATASDSDDDKPLQNVPQVTQEHLHQEMPALIQGVMSLNPQEQLEATARFRKILSKGARFQPRTQPAHCRSHCMRRCAQVCRVPSLARATAASIQS